MISGAKAKGRDFVYWTEVKNIPNTDLATIERLWQQFSGGKFGYSVQKVRRYYGTTLLSSYREKMSKSCVTIRLCLLSVECSIDEDISQLDGLYRRKNGSKARVILKCFVKRSVGRLKTVRWRERSVGLVHLNLSMM